MGKDSMIRVGRSKEASEVQRRNVVIPDTLPATNRLSVTFICGESTLGGAGTYADLLRYFSTSFGASPLVTWDSAKSLREYSTVRLMLRVKLGVTKP